MNHPRDNHTGSTYPHKRKHLGSHTRANIQARLTRHRIAENDKHNRCDNRRGGDEKRRDESPNGVEPGNPTRVDGEEGEEDVTETHNDTGDEEAEHDVTSDADETEDIVYFSGESNGCAGEEFIEEDIDGVEPVEVSGGGAGGDAFIVVAFAEIPEADLVEIVEAEGTGERVLQCDAAADGFGNDVCEVESEKPGIADDGTVVYISYYCLRFVC
ncbi:hypothetical protein BCON_0239g00090 [Botryotinia convoluta]|uniref:Uncharacterized protein n=1 Tax=Botryotinia convoluta TaxID=54673 RepID=A0A4Z1HU49_9HELO|nr:hypothetical protein BCON_0239g00090 [Botryotinia convoluta]